LSTLHYFYKSLKFCIFVQVKPQSVVKAEILKLVDNGIIYPIFDSQWVSPVHAVPKKAGFTVVENEKKSWYKQDCLPRFMSVSTTES